MYFEKIKIKLRKSSFFWVLLKMNMLPLILLTLVISTFSAARFVSSMNVEAKNGLMNLCHTVYLMKGERLLNDDFTIIDSIKEKNGADITIFYDAGCMSGNGSFFQ